MALFSSPERNNCQGQYYTNAEANATNENSFEIDENLTDTSLLLEESTKLTKRTRREKCERKERRRR